MTGSIRLVVRVVPIFWPESIALVVAPTPAPWGWRVQWQWEGRLPCYPVSGVSVHPAPTQVLIVALQPGEEPIRNNDLGVDIHHTGARKNRLVE